MSNEEIQQRIAYLVEHGGLYDDPLADIRKTARTAVWLAAATLVVLALVLIFHP
jgi:hypothetical protein